MCVDWCDGLGKLSRMTRTYLGSVENVGVSVALNHRLAVRSDEGDAEGRDDGGPAGDLRGPGAPGGVPATSLAGLRRLARRGAGNNPGRESHVFSSLFRLRLRSFSSVLAPPLSSPRSRSVLPCESEHFISTSPARPARPAVIAKSPSSTF